MVLEIQVRVEEHGTNRHKDIIIPVSNKEFEMMSRLGDIENGKPAYELVISLIGDLQKEVDAEQQLDINHPEKYFFKINLVKCDRCKERCDCTNNDIWSDTVNEHNSTGNGEW